MIKKLMLSKLIELDLYKIYKIMLSELLGELLIKNEDFVDIIKNHPQINNKDKYIKLILQEINRKDKEELVYKNIRETELNNILKIVFASPGYKDSITYIFEELGNKINNGKISYKKGLYITMANYSLILKPIKFLTFRNFMLKENYTVDFSSRDINSNMRSDEEKEISFYKEIDRNIKDLEYKLLSYEKKYIKSIIRKSIINKLKEQKEEINSVIINSLQEILKETGSKELLIELFSNKKVKAIFYKDILNKLKSKLTKEM